MTAKWLSALGIICFVGVGLAQQRWLTPADRNLTTDGVWTEFALPNAGSGPTTIAIADDGTLWFTESSGNRIGRINPDGSGLREFALPNPDSSPRIIALGSDRNMWFSEHTGNRIGRITPDGTIAEFPIPTPDSGPRALAAGPDGNIWFSEFNASKIGRITPEGKITEFVLPRPNSGPGDITAGADGHMWFVELAGQMDGRKPDGNRVGRITMDGTISEFMIPSPTGSPINIAVGPDRNIWFTKGGAVGRVTPDGTITEFRMNQGVSGTGLTAGSDRQPPARLTNRLWVAASGGNRLTYLQFK